MRLLALTCLAALALAACGTSNGGGPQISAMTSGPAAELPPDSEGIFEIDRSTARQLGTRDRRSFYVATGASGICFLAAWNGKPDGVSCAPDLASVAELPMISIADDLKRRRMTVTALVTDDVEGLSIDGSRFKAENNLVVAEDVPAARSIEITRENGSSDSFPLGRQRP